MSRKIGYVLERCLRSQAFVSTGVGIPRIKLVEYGDRMIFSKAYTITPEKTPSITPHLFS